MNSRLSAAKRNKQDEYYTQISDIEDEVKRYADHFKDKVIFCNCDDPEWSNFWMHFKLKFDEYGLEKLVTTHYDEDKPTYKLVVDGTKRDKEGRPVEVKTALKGNGDFRSSEAIEILKEADIVVTNPPFSLFREYVSQLMLYEKKFLIIGNKNAVTYNEVFDYISRNEMWVGVRPMNRDMWLEVPEGYNYEKIVDGLKLKHIMACWYTNLPHTKRYEDLILYKKYYGNEDEYPRFDNYDAINIDKVKDIPYDYKGIMGVPITFLDKYNPEQFDILGMTKTPICHRNTPEAQPIKKYLNGKQHSKDGSIRTGNKVNDGSAILHKEIPDKRPYYTADNAEGYLVAQYPRILIKSLRGVDDDN